MSKKRNNWLLKSLLVAAATVWLAVWQLPDDKLHITMCDVGQGQAILLSKRHSQVLIDTGPGSRVLECLGKEMPFYDRKLEAIVLTHNQADHAGGTEAVMNRYEVGEVWNRETNRVLAAGDVVKFEGVEIQVLWPVERTNVDTNEQSLVAVVKYGDFEMLVTGDLDEKTEARVLGWSNIDVLQVPHHGSKYGMTKEWLETVKPELAVISVGKNSYGHPTAEALQLLQEEGAEVLRTDERGDIEMVTDGKEWWVKN